MTRFENFTVLTNPINRFEMRNRILAAMTRAERILVAQRIKSNVPLIVCGDGDEPLTISGIEMAKELGLNANCLLAELEEGGT